MLADCGTNVIVIVYSGFRDRQVFLILRKTLGRVK